MQDSGTVVSTLPVESHASSSPELHMRVRYYRDLAVWQRSMDLSVECHRLLKGFPSEERFGLTAQIRRASVSVPSSVAEGHAKGYRQLYASHVGRSRGSLAELETEMTLAERFEYLEHPATFWNLSDEVSRMLGSP
jgi:four helix bundle protein